MNGKNMLAGIVLLGFLQAAAPAKDDLAQADFSAFWKKFRTAVRAGDQATVAGLTKFPFSLYASHIKDRAEFLRRYKVIFDGEANAAQCFASAEPQKDSARRYSIYCPFKKTPNDLENAPIRFVFELTKHGWKFVALDNINE